MFSIVQETIATVPVLHIVKTEKYKHILPLVIFQHGYTSAKEHNLHYAYLLAEKGFRVILPDALHHGERENDISFEQRELQFWDIVVQSIQEIGNIKNELEERNLIHKDKIALAGTSMGGIVTFGALTQYDWIKAGVSLMGCPCYVELAQNHLKLLASQNKVTDEWQEKIAAKIEGLSEFDLTKQLEKIYHKSLFVWHGEKDEIVPYSLTRRFIEEIQSTTADSESDVTFISDPLADHKVSREGILAVVNWLNSQLFCYEQKAH